MTGNQVTVPLDYPIEVDGKTVSSLTLRRPKAKDLISAERQPGEIGEEVALIAICAGIPFADAGEIDAADYRRIVRETQLGFTSGDAGARAPSATPESPAASGGPSSSSTDGPAGASPTSST
ncbi:MAG: phage tail assembly protein [Rhodospirillaceae bacterium]|nr:phage tail assembly protein [Rhodospirillaceae bacterium]